MEIVINMTYVFTGLFILYILYFIMKMYNHLRLLEVFVLLATCTFLACCIVYQVHMLYIATGSIYLMITSMLINRRIRNQLKELEEISKALDETIEMSKNQTSLDQSSKEDE
ncbi:hypothetical protein SAMN04487866_12621 [Thermoactinomyces sp. DSM 45891]|uniref:hypothetical protein n=1 Tax=Thermoactinomyces sp. DSM 45891 TaxID=1761907 RepID=UPI000923B768|nr:hypothetical protein [Thermoactinomyces sp. DSM 45891]SFX79453.1 hypothetical protein SAMN04487866_12621 [Thermoactinomyces sp. DSM 45891]